MITLNCKDVELVVGPPGVGKTTEAIRIVKEYLNGGGHPDKVAFVSFTKQAISEAVDKLKISPKPKWFRTLHSLCFHLIGAKTDDIIDTEEIAGLMDNFGPEVEDYAFIYDISRTENKPIEEVWARVSLDRPVDSVALMEYVQWYQNYKETFARYDYIDLLENYLKLGLAPELDLVIVDEAQDLSGLQWQVVQHFVTNAEKVILFGDPDQSIYEWAGVENVLEDVAYTSRRVLEQSYRLPVHVWEVACNLLEERDRPIEYSPRAEQGSVTLLATSSDWMGLNLERGDWLLLGRTQYQTQALKDILYEKGIYAQDISDRKKDSKDRVLRHIQTYIRLMDGENVNLREAKYIDPQICGGDMVAAAKKRIPWNVAFIALSAKQREFYEHILSGVAPTVRLSTFHGAKGAEAENVILFGNITSTVQNAMLRDPDPELRLLYVAVTRARKNLYLSPGDRKLAYQWSALL